MPRTSDYLKKAEDEFNYIDGKIFGGPGSPDYDSQRRQHIVRDDFPDIFKFKPDIIHFTGHGSENGSILDDVGRAIEPQDLRQIFENQIQKEIQLLFLNACYSANLFSELQKVKAIKTIIGIDTEIGDTAAYTFAAIFYKYYLYDKNIPKAYLKAASEYKFRYPQAAILQAFHPSEKLTEVTQYEPTLDKVIRENNIRVRQWKQIPTELMLKIQSTIRAFDDKIMIRAFGDKIMISSDPIMFKAELRNISNILPQINSPEYAINIEWQELRDKQQEIDDLINGESDLPLEGPTLTEKIKDVYNDIIINIFKKIYFDIIIDSIEKVPPLLPEDLDDELLGAMIGIMYSILKSLSILREKINLCFDHDNFYKDYLMSRCHDLINYINLDFDDLRDLLRYEVPDSNKDDPNRDDLNKSYLFYSLFEDVKNQLEDLDEEMQGARSQDSKNGRITRLKDCLEDISDVEEGLINLIRTAIMAGAEHKRISSHRETDNNFSVDGTPLDDDSVQERNYEDIQKIETELEDNPDTLEPQELFSLVTKLLEKIQQEYKVYSKNGAYRYSDIYSCFKGIRDTLQLVKDNIPVHWIKHPYIFPEIMELCNFWRFRLNALERKQVRKYLNQIDYYFSKEMYMKVADSSDVKGNKDNIKVLNIKLLNKIGVANLFVKNYEKAEEKFNKILKIDKSNKVALFNLGIVYQEQDSLEVERKFERSINQFETILRNDPNHVNALTSLGILFYKIQKYDDALPHIEKAIRLSEHENWRALLTKGCILSDGRQQYQDSKLYFEKCESLNPNSIVINLNKAQNLIFLKLYRDSEDLLSKILYKIKDIEDRSTKIITTILLICSRYLRMKNEPADVNEREANAKYIENLLRLINLKDSKFVEWDFHNLQNIVDSDPEIKSEYKDFLKDILSIPGNNVENEKLKKQIQDFVIRNKLVTNKVEYVPEYNNKMQVRIQGNSVKDEIIKSEVEWFVWKISFKLLPDYFKDKTVKSIVFKFDPTFKNFEQEFPVEDNNQEFWINVLGTDERKFEIEVNLVNGYTLKMVNKLRIPTDKKS